MRLKKTMYLFVLAFVIIDQVTKFLVENNLPFATQVEMLPFFSFFRSYNTGIAFSMFNWVGNGILIAVGLAVLALVIWLWQHVGKHQQLAHLGYALIVGGAFGNLIDRVTQGHVIDFLLFHTGNWAFAVFNFADAFITVGAIAIIIDELINMRRRRKMAAQNPNDPEQT